MLFEHWFPPHVTCSAVQDMGAALLFCTDCHNRCVIAIVLLPLCFKLVKGTFLCFKMCTHVGTYINATIILYAECIQLFLCCTFKIAILCEDDVVLFVYNVYISKRGTCICAHAWIFFKLCIIMTHYIQTMKMYVLN